MADLADQSLLDDDAPAIEVTSMRYATQSPIRGRYVLDSPLITAENAAEFCFPGSPC